MKLENYYLDLKVVMGLTSEQQNRINAYYLDMMNYYCDPDRQKIAISIFHTLYEAGYLREIRDDKINKILS